MRLLVGCLFLLVDLTLSQQPVTSTECEKNVGCFREPSTCTSSDDCDALITFVYDSGNNRVQFTMSSKSQYLGLGHYETITDASQNMTGGRGEVCFLDSGTVQLKSFRASKNGIPTLVNLDSGVSLTESYTTAAGSIVCQFSRVISPGASQYLSDLNKNLYTLLAWGTYNGDLGYHYTGRVLKSPQSLKYTMSSAITTTPNPATTTPQTSVVDLSDCDVAYNCFKIPEDCNSASSCDAIAKFRYDSNDETIVFELATKNKWMAITQRPTSLTGAGMIGIRGEYCAKTAPLSLGHVNGNDLTKNDLPAFKDQVDGVTVESIEEKDGIIICKYRKAVVPPAASKDWLYDLNAELKIVAAYGISLNGKRPDKHPSGAFARTAGDVDFFKIQVIKPTIGREAKKIEKAHGCLMVLAWIFFSTIGIFMARYMKVPTNDKMILDKPAWFPIHVSFMLMCVISFIVGLILILTEHSKIDTDNKHHMFGLFTIIAGLIQPVMAMFRPAPDHEKRFIFNWAHRTVGMLAWILGGVSIIYALDLFKENEVPMIVFMIIVIVLFVLLDIILMLSGNKETNRGQPSASFDKTQESLSTSTGAAKKQNTVAHWVFFCLVVGVVIGFTIYHIYVVASLD